MTSLASSKSIVPKEWVEKYNEIFAELIVRECANVANSGIDPGESRLIGDDILEHFGVEP